MVDRWHYVCPQCGCADMRQTAEVERLRETLREVRDRWAFPKLVEIVDGALDEAPEPIEARADVERVERLRAAFDEEERT